MSRKVQSSREHSQEFSRRMGAGKLTPILSAGGRRGAWQVARTWFSWSFILRLTVSNSHFDLRTLALFHCCQLGELEGAPSTMRGPHAPWPRVLSEVHQDGFKPCKLIKAALSWVAGDGRGLFSSWGKMFTKRQECLGLGRERRVGRQCCGYHD